MKQVVQSYKNGEVNLFDVPVPVCKKGGVLVRNVRSLISIGTEKLMIETGKKSLLAKAKARPDLVKKCIDKARKEGFINVFQEAMNRLDEPVALGYSSAGVVVETNGIDSDLKAGDRVACLGAGFASHAEMIWVPENLCVLIPDGVDFEEAAFVTLGAIGLHGIRTARTTFGETVAVIGLGLIGQLDVQMLKAAGSRVIGIDIDPKKVETAKKYGADLALTPDDNMYGAIENFTKGHGVDGVVITAAAADNKPIEISAKIARKNARVVLVGVADLQLDRTAFWEKELIFTVIKGPGPGCLESMYELGGQDYPINYVRWTEQRNMTHFLNMLAGGKIDVKSLITHRYKIDDAKSAYEMILNKKEPCIGVVLEYEDKDITANDERTRTKIEPAPEADVPKHTGCKNIGFIGGGLFTKNILLPAFKKVKNVNLKAIATARGMTSRHLLKKFGFGYCTSDYREILNDKDIDSVVIVTRHDSHGKFIKEALEAGKSVYVEKPLCISEDELKQIIAAYEKNRHLNLMVGFNRRYSEFAQKTKEVFGRRNMPLVMTYRINAGFLQADHWAQNSDEGGGRIIGEMCHYVDIFQFISGEHPVSVFTDSISHDTGKFMQGDNVCVTIKFSQGSLGVIIYAAAGTKAYSREKIEIFGNETVVMIDDYRQMLIVEAGKRKLIKRFSQDEGYVQELDYFINKITPRQSEAVFRQDVYTTLTTIKAQESLKKKAPVLIDYEALVK